MYIITKILLKWYLQAPKMIPRHLPGTLCIQRMHFGSPWYRFWRLWAAFGSHWVGFGRPLGHFGVTFWSKWRYRDPPWAPFWEVREPGILISQKSMSLCSESTVLETCLSMGTGSAFRFRELRSILERVQQSTHIKIQPYCHIVTLSHRHIVAFSDCHIVTLSHVRTIQLVVWTLH